MPNLHLDKPMALHLFTVNVVVSVALQDVLCLWFLPNSPHVASVASGCL